MRAVVAFWFTAAAVSLYASALSAAAMDFAARSQTSPILRIGWNWYHGGYRPACPWGYHYACRRDPYGRPYCACWPNY